MLLILTLWLKSPLLSKISFTDSKTFSQKNFLLDFHHKEVLTIASNFNQAKNQSSVLSIDFLSRIKRS